MAKKQQTSGKFTVVGLLVLVFVLSAVLLFIYLKKSSCETVTAGKGTGKTYFADRFNAIYDGQTRKRGWETYVDLPNSMAINYPDFYHVTSVCPAPRPSCLNLHFENVPTVSIMYNDTIIFYLTQPPESQKTTSLQDYAKSQSAYSIENQDVATFEAKNINGNEVIIADFVMTKKLHDSEAEYNKHRSKPIALEPVGFHRKMAFIKNGEQIYTLKSGSLFEPYQEEVFNTMLESLKLNVM